MAQTVKGQKEPPQKPYRPGQRQQERMQRQARLLLAFGSINALMQTVPQHRLPARMQQPLKQPVSMRLQQQHSLPLVSLDCKTLLLQRLDQQNHQLCQVLLLRFQMDFNIQMSKSDVGQQHSRAVMYLRNIRVGFRKLVRNLIVPGIATLRHSLQCLARGR